MMEESIKEHTQSKDVVCTLHIEGGSQHVLLKPQIIQVEKYVYNEPNRSVVVTAASCPNCNFLAEDKSFETNNEQNANLSETKKSPRNDISLRRLLRHCRSYHGTIIDENIKTMVQLEDERSVKLGENSTDEEKLRLAQSQPYWLNAYTDEDIEMIPYIEKEDNKLSLWKDVKEILFPRCQDPCCVIVLSCLKHIFKYPTDLKIMHSCTEHEQSLFMRRFQMVHSGSLLVSLLAVRENIDYLTKLVEKRHRGSKVKCWYEDVQCLKCKSKPRIKTAKERRSEIRSNRRPKTANGSMAQQQIANKEQMSLPALYLPDDVARRLHSSSVSSLGPDVDEDTVEFPVMLTYDDEDILVPCSILTHIYPQSYNILTYYSNNLITKSFTNNQIVQATARQAAAFNYWMDCQDNHIAIPLFTSGSLMMKLSDFSLDTIGLLPLQTRQFLLVSCDWSNKGDSDEASGINHDEDTCGGNVTPCNEEEMRFYGVSRYDTYDDQIRAQLCELAAEDSDVYEFERYSRGRESSKESNTTGMKLVKKKTLRVFDKEPVNPFRSPSPKKSKLRHKKQFSRSKKTSTQMFAEQSTVEPNSLPIPIQQSPRIKSGKKSVVSTRYKSPYLVQAFVKKVSTETKRGNSRSHSPYVPKVITNKHRESTSKMAESTDQIEKESGNITRKVYLRPKPVNMSYMAKWPKKTTSQPLPSRKSACTINSLEISHSLNDSFQDKKALKKHAAAKEFSRAIRSNLCTKLRKEWREKHMRESSKHSQNVNEETNLKEKNTSKSCLRKDLSRMVVGSKFCEDHSNSTIIETDSACESSVNMCLESSSEDKRMDSWDRDNSSSENKDHLSSTPNVQMKATEMSLHDVCNHKEAGNNPVPPWEAYNLQLDGRQSHPHRFNSGLTRSSTQTMSRSPATKAYDFGGSTTNYEEYSISASTSVCAASSTSSVQFNQENSQQFCPGPNPSLQGADTTQAAHVSSNTMATANLHNESKSKNTSETIIEKADTLQNESTAKITSETAIENSESPQKIDHQNKKVKDSTSVDSKIPDMSGDESRVGCGETKSAMDESLNKATENAEVSKQHQVNEIVGRYIFIPDILSITGINLPDKSSNKPNITQEKNDKKGNTDAEKLKLKEGETKVSRSEANKPQHIKIHSCMELHSPKKSQSSPQQSTSETIGQPNQCKQSPQSEVQDSKHEVSVGRSCPEFSTRPNSVSGNTPRSVYLQYNVKARRSAGAVLQGPQKTRPYFYRKGFIPGKICKMSGSAFREYREESCPQHVAFDATSQRDVHTIMRTNSDTADFLTVKGTASFPSPSRSSIVVTSASSDCSSKRNASKTEQRASSSPSHKGCNRRGKVYIAPSPSTESIQAAQNASEKGSFLHMHDLRSEEMFESGMYQGSQNPANWEAASSYLAAVEEISNLKEDFRAMSLHSCNRRLSANPIRSFGLCRECSANSDNQAKYANFIQSNTTEKETGQEPIAKTQSKKQTSASKIVNVVFQYHHQNQRRRASTAYMPTHLIENNVDLSAEKERPHTCDPRQRAIKTGQRLKICIDLMNGAPMGKQMTGICPLEIKKIDL